MKGKLTGFNEGPLDRVLRVVLGVALLSLTVIGPQTAWGWIGLLPLITGVSGFCPLYIVLGINTCPTKPT
jgi:hypothetical protein